ncbi:hypothetical protein [Bacillus sp. C1]
MLTGLRIFFGLLTIVLCIYFLLTDNFALIPYIQISLSCTFILIGIHEIKAGRKSMSIPYFGISVLMFFFVLSKLFY